MAAHPAALAEQVSSWLRSVPTTPDNSEIMEAPSTPRSASSHSRGRNLSPQTHRTRNLHNLYPQTYRTRNLQHANVLVEAVLPHTIDQELREMLGIKSWADKVVAPDEPRFKDAVNCYLDDSRRNARGCALDGEWKYSLCTLIRKLLPISADELKMNTSEKGWNSALKPKPPRTQTRHSALPSFNLNDAATALSGPLPSLPPLAPSIATSSSMDWVNPFYISTPKPDITVGLAHTTFQPRQQRCLVAHQASQSILSDPHVDDMGLRFPFLVVEAKGLSLAGGLLSAQNQAAVSGAAMLAILGDLSDQADGHGAQAPESGATLQETPALCISIVTIGPIHDLSVHFMHKEKYCMHPFQTCRTTLKADAQRFVALLVRIIEWGKGRYKEDIVEKLDRRLGCT